MIGQEDMCSIYLQGTMTVRPHLNEHHSKNKTKNNTLDPSGDLTATFSHNPTSGIEKAAYSGRKPELLWRRACSVIANIIYGRIYQTQRLMKRC